MSAARTVMVQTLDHGPVAVPEPSWCLGGHAAQTEGLRADIVHEGPEHAATFRGVGLLSAALVEYPFAEHAGRGPAVAIDMGQGFTTSGPGGLRELAVALIDHAATLRHLARELDALTNEEASR